MPLFVASTESTPTAPETPKLPTLSMAPVAASAAPATPAVPESPAPAIVATTPDVPAPLNLAPLLPASAEAPTAAAVAPIAPPAQIAPLAPFERIAHLDPVVEPPTPSTTRIPLDDIIASGAVTAPDDVEYGNVEPEAPALVAPVVVAPEEAPVAAAETGPSAPAPTPEPAAALTPVLAPEPAVPAPAAPLLPTGAAAAAAPSAPSMPKPPAADQSATAGLFNPAAAQQQAQKVNLSNRPKGRGLFLTVLAVALAAGAGVGARLGYDWYESRDVVETPVAAVVEAPADLVDIVRADPPAIRYTDTVTSLATDTGTRVLTAHLDLATGAQIVNVVDTALDGTVNAFDVDVRADEAFIRRSPDAQWEAIGVDDARGSIGRGVASTVFTISDLVPRAAAAHVTVLEDSDQQLPLSPIISTERIPAQNTASPDGSSTNASVPSSAARPAVDAPTPDTSVVPVAPPVVVAPDSLIAHPERTAPTAVREYRFVIDLEGFRAADFAAFEAWVQRLGPAASDRLDAWVDADGVVRQISYNSDAGNVTSMLVTAAPATRRFDSNPLLDQAAAAPAAPVAPEAGG